MRLSVDGIAAAANIADLLAAPQFSQRLDVEAEAAGGLLLLHFGLEVKDVAHQETSWVRASMATRRSGLRTCSPQRSSARVSGHIGFGTPYSIIKVGALRLHGRDT